MVGINRLYGFKFVVDSGGEVVHYLRHFLLQFRETIYCEAMVYLSTESLHPSEPLSFLERVYPESTLAEDLSEVILDPLEDLRVDF